MSKELRRALRNGSLLVLLVVVTLGLSSRAISESNVQPPAPPDVTVGLEEDGGGVQLSEGQLLSVTLEANPTTGYTWEVVEPEVEREGTGILRKVGPVGFEPQSQLLCAPGIQTLRFEPISAGDTTVRLAYRRPWEIGTEPMRTFSLQVRTTGVFTDVAPASEVSSPQAAVERLDRSEIGADLGLPTAFNWCDLGGCTPVKDQGDCGSCWSFATVGVLESNILIHNAVTRDLSEQYLVSCNTEGWGCDGGLEAHDYNWWKVPPCESAAGSVYETDFGYVGWEAPCNPPHQHHERIGLWGFVGNWWSVPSVADLKQTIYDHGPVFVGVCAGLGWGYYTGGVFETDEASYCSGGTNHAVVLVGWDDNQGTNGVWFVRNSWGSSWGESGYMRIGYGVSNVGEAASYVVYPPSSAEAGGYLPLSMKAPSEPDEGWVPIVTESFEGPYLGCWVVEDYRPGYGEYYWGKRDCLPYRGTYSGWAVGSGWVGDVLWCGDNYPNYAYSWMVYGPFSLTDATAGELKFKLWLNTEIDYDWFCSCASLDGLNFGCSCTSGYSAGWMAEVLDLGNVSILGDLTGESQVWVALVFESDSIVNYAEGAYVDNIVLRKYVSPAAAPAPSISSAQAVPSGAQISETERVLVWDNSGLGAAGGDSCPRGNCSN